MFTAQLINDPFGDPGVYLELKHRREALLFDMGDLHPLAPRQLLKIRYVFISHTHMDHFIGFDHLLRISLGRDSHIALFGPPGFHANVENKLKAYTWNLVENYENDFQLSVTEVHSHHQITRRYLCRKAFKPDQEEICGQFDGTLVDDKLFSVQGEFLDHRIPSLAFRFQEKQRINIKRNVLDEMGIPTGAWLTTFKDRIMSNDADDAPISILQRDDKGGLEERTLSLGMLKEEIVKITPGRAVTYVTDAVYHDENARKIVKLASGAEVLFIEAPFLEEDAEKAALKYHLTALQAGSQAKAAGVKRIVLFHFSPKYKGAGHLLVQEAMQAFAGEAPS